MMLRLSLLAEGGSDAVLLAPIKWMLDRDPAVGEYAISRADFGQFPRPPRSLAERVARTFEVDEPDILLVHRDADKARLAAERAQEITRAAATFRSRCVPVVPVLMSESWFLFDELALRRAAGSTSSSTPLKLPPVSALESEGQPKDKLRDCLRTASGLKGSRLRKFEWRAAYHRLSDTIEDFEPLLELPSFVRTVDALHEAIESMGDRRRGVRGA